MVQKFIYLLSIFASTYTYADTPLKSLLCTTQLPSTNFLVRVKEKTVELQVSHHRGLNLAPIHNGLITTSDLSWIKLNTENIKKLGRQFNVVFKKERCKRLSKNNVSCSLSDATQVGDLKIKSAHLNIYTRLTSSIYGDYNEVLAEFSFRVDSEVRRLPMKYLAKNCRNLF